ncbi:MAG: hypothetical protein IPI85_05605 [Dehalococcoidia bacterium]|nr:hypothetical protein [Dehalococcoidia bacterium]
MDHSDNGHATHGDSSQADSTLWPVAAGIGALLLGAALLFYTRDQDAAFAAPLLGAAIVVALFAMVGWVWDDRRTKQRAASGARHW